MGTKVTDHGYYVWANKKHSVFHRRVCLLEQGDAIPGCACVGASRIFDFDGMFLLADLREYIRDQNLNPISLSFDDIWVDHAPGNGKERVMAQKRYVDADPAYPGIVSSIRNPDNKTYRLLDGRRRLWKQQEMGAESGLFYNIPEPDVYDYFWLLIRKSDHLRILGEFSAEQERR